MFKMKNPFAKKASPPTADPGTPDLSIETETGGPPRGEAWKHRLQNLSFRQMAGGFGVVLLFVFLLHEIVSVVKTHRHYVAKKNSIAAHFQVMKVKLPPPGLQTQFHHLPPISDSAEALYLGLSSLSEFTKIRVHFLDPKSGSVATHAQNLLSFSGWAVPLGLIPGLYSGRVTITVFGPITVAGTFLPFIQELFQDNNGILESVDFSKNATGTGKGSQPKLVLSGTLYGSTPRPDGAGTPAPQGLVSPAVGPGTIFPVGKAFSTGPGPTITH